MYAITLQKMFWHKKGCVYMNLYAETASLQGKPGEPYHRFQFTYYYVTGATVHRLKQTKSWMKADLYLFQLVITEKQFSKRISCKHLLY